MSDNIEKPTVNDEISKEKGVNEKVKCTCGKMISKPNLTVHERTFAHIKNLHKLAENEILTSTIKKEFKKELDDIKLILNLNQLLLDDKLNDILNIITGKAIGQKSA